LLSLKLQCLGDLDNRHFQDKSYPSAFYELFNVLKALAQFIEGLPFSNFRQKQPFFGSNFSSLADNKVSSLRFLSSMYRNFANFLNILLVFVIFSATPCLAQDECQLSIKEIEPGVDEINMGNVSAKIESRNNIVKMKIPEAFETHSWTWASTEKGSARIDGVIERNGKQGVLSQLIAVKNGSNELNWAVFKSDNPFAKSNSGKAFFVIKGATYCVQTSLESWKTSVKSVFGQSFSENATVHAVSSTDAYAKLGLS